MKLMSIIRILIITLVLFTIGCRCGNVDQDSRWQHLRRRCMGTWGYGVQSDISATLREAAPLSYSDAAEASSLIGSLLIDNEFSDYTLEMCKLDAESIWHVSFKRDKQPFSRINVDLDAEGGFVRRVQTLGIPIKRRTIMYNNMTSANQHLADSIPESGSLAAALCAREIAAILNYFCHGWEVTRMQFDEMKEEWTFHLFLHSGEGAKIVLNENLMLLEYIFDVSGSLNPRF